MVTRQNIWSRAPFRFDHLEVARRELLCRDGVVTHDGGDFQLLQTKPRAIWYLSGSTFIRSAYGPSLPNGWALVATPDFNGDGNSDCELYNRARVKRRYIISTTTVSSAGRLVPPFQSAGAWSASNTSRITLNDQ
jgi:hypothetical protein